MTSGVQARRDQDESATSDRLPGRGVCYDGGVVASPERCSTSRTSGYADVKPLTDRLLARLSAELDERLVAVALYGSVARGEARAESDVDLFLVYRGDRESVADTFVEVELELRAAPLTAELQARGVPTNPMPVLRTEAALVDTPWLLLDISHHGIILFDPGQVLHAKLAALRRRLAELGSRRIELADGSWYWDLKPDLRPGEMIEL